ncbi:CotD family spore coat protein [Aureibacillus halotolerans]|uniref:Inner spore coat protein D n=1 Tax=Aureibacillus halotolerans TaxID=1508390 RepID=A0A4R6U4T6_9BACI|nr:CotD family spore coat protein [Aureibacillus halotolerans]TDQ41478.1 inner spore coat protein D [Aureibacillus halotolerans]
MFNHCHKPKKPMQCCPMPSNQMPTNQLPAMSQPMMMPANVHPTRTVVENQFFHTIVPHIHPIHIEKRQHQMYEHRHYYPQTVSNVADAQHQHFDCCPEPPEKHHDCD